jgi:uncharacterized Ntn-hydrolase superfamily protein
VYDITLLSREPPSRLLRIEGEVSTKVQTALHSLGYLKHIDYAIFGDKAQRALQEYVNVSNFENKMRTDGTIWQSVYEHLIEEGSRRQHLPT